MLLLGNRADLGVRLLVFMNGVSALEGDELLLEHALANFLGGGDMETAILVQTDDKPMFLVLQPDDLKVLAFLLLLAEDLGLAEGGWVGSLILFDFDDAKKTAVDCHDIYIVLLLEDGDNKHGVRVNKRPGLETEREIRESNIIIFLEEGIDILSPQFEVIDRCEVRRLQSTEGVPNFLVLVRAKHKSPTLFHLLHQHKRTHWPVLPGVVDHLRKIDLPVGVKVPLREVDEPFAGGHVHCKCVAALHETPLFDQSASQFENHLNRVCYGEKFDLPGQPNKYPKFSQLDLVDVVIVDRGLWLFVRTDKLAVTIVLINGHVMQSGSADHVTVIS
jgi:hypothetical protein